MRHARDRLRFADPVAAARERPRAPVSAGGVVVPIYPTDSPEQCEWVASNSEARMIVCEDWIQAGKIAQVRERLPSLDYVIVIALAVFAILSIRVHAFWARVGQGITILRDRRRYAREMVTWQLGAWAFRFITWWLMLVAFHIGGTLRNVLLVQAVQVISAAGSSFGALAPYFR